MSLHAEGSEKMLYRLSAGKQGKEEGLEDGENNVSEIARTINLF